MGDSWPPDGGELQSKVLLAAVLARRIDGVSFRLADLQLARDAQGSLRVVLDGVTPERIASTLAESAREGAPLALLSRTELSNLAASMGTPAVAVHARAPEASGAGLRVALSVSGFTAGGELPLETVSMDFVPEGSGWRLVAGPLHRAD